MAQISVLFLSACAAVFIVSILAKPPASTPEAAPNLAIWECLPKDPHITELRVTCRYVLNSLAVPQRSSVSIPVIGNFYLTQAECSLKCAIPCRERQFQGSCSLYRNSAKTAEGIKRRLRRCAKYHTRNTQKKPPSIPKKPPSSPKRPQRPLGKPQRPLGIPKRPPSKAQRPQKTLKRPRVTSTKKKTKFSSPVRKNRKKG